jgi:hypothetical protein
MPDYYYGTVPVLAWIINHFLYGGVHHAWLAAEFYPLATNPKSSNPYLIYGDLYHPWSWGDGFDRCIGGYRKSLKAGVNAVEAAGRIDQITAARLRRICDSADVALFYPVVYRVDINRIGEPRCLVAGSGLEGSREVLVRDLREHEFDLLFADNQNDELFVMMVRRERGDGERLDGRDVLGLLEQRSAA